jgi:hypothetical protein
MGIFFMVIDMLSYSESCQEKNGEYSDVQRFRRNGSIFAATI